MTLSSHVFDPADWFRAGRGPRYLQLQRHIAEAIRSGQLVPDDQLPPERDLAAMADVSRVTVRKAVAQLVADGLVEQRQGAGSFVRAPVAQSVEQSLSSLVSFTENMQARGMTSSSEVVSATLSTPASHEIYALGVSSTDKIARVKRLRSANGIPMALETSALPRDVLPDPSLVRVSLYAVLRTTGHAPTRAVQRVTAVSLGPRDAEQLRLPEGTAVLQIDRTGYLSSGRPIEFTRGVYRSDIYDFVSELRLD